MTKHQLQTYMAACKAWTEALRTRDNAVPYRGLFDTLDHSMFVAIPW